MKDITNLKFWVSDKESGETLALVTAQCEELAIEIAGKEYDLETVKVQMAETPKLSTLTV